MAMVVIARLTFHEARRRKILWLAFILGLAFIGLFATGFHFLYRELSVDPDFRAAVNFFLMAGLYVINFLVVMMTVLTSVDTVSGEVASHTIQTVVTKPIHRWQVVLGKWVGFVLMLGLYIVLMAGGVVGVVYAISRYLPPNLVQGILLMALQGLVLLTLSILGGTLLSTLANGVLVFMLYGLAFIGGWIEQIGSLLRNETAVNLGIISSLLMPSEALWKRAAYLMQPTLIRDLGVTPFSAASAPSEAMVAYSVLYIVAVLGAAVVVFQRRDL